MDRRDNRDKMLEFMLQKNPYVVIGPDSVDHTVPSRYKFTGPQMFTSIDHNPPLTFFVPEDVA